MCHLMCHPHQGSHARPLPPVPFPRHSFSMLNSEATAWSRKPKSFPLWPGQHLQYRPLSNWVWSSSAIHGYQYGNLKINLAENTSKTSWKVKGNRAYRRHWDDLWWPQESHQKFSNCEECHWTLYPAVLDRGGTKHNEHNRSSVLRVEMNGRRLPL